MNVEITAQKAPVASEEGPNTQEGKNVVGNSACCPATEQASCCSPAEKGSCCAKLGSSTCGCKS